MRRKRRTTQPLLLHSPLDVLERNQHTLHRTVGVHVLSIGRRLTFGAEAIVAQVVLDADLAESVTARDGGGVVEKTFAEERVGVGRQGKGGKGGRGVSDGRGGLEGREYGWLLPNLPHGTLDELRKLVDKGLLSCWVEECQALGREGGGRGWCCRPHHSTTTGSFFHVALVVVSS
jgi:hypothetical protein